MPDQQQDKLTTAANAVADAMAAKCVPELDELVSALLQTIANDPALKQKVADFLGLSEHGAGEQQQQQQQQQSGRRTRQVPTRAEQTPRPHRP